jgi:hypothetical protein
MNLYIMFVLYYAAALAYEVAFNTGILQAGEAGGAYAFPRYGQIRRRRQAAAACRITIRTYYIMTDTHRVDFNIDVSKYVV